MSRLLIVLGFTVGITACVGGDGNTNTPENTPVDEAVDLTRMMANYADNVFFPLYETFNIQSASENSVVISEYCAAIGTANETSTLVNAQEYWRELMRTWQRAEAFILGPLKDRENSLRNAIYSYGSISPPSTCAVDQSVVLAQQTSFDIASRTSGSRGLDALEYLLFNSDLEQSCPVQVTQDPNWVALQEWNGLSETERKQQRCEYAQRVIEDIHDSSQTLVHAWRFEGGDYRTSFINPANLSASYAELSEALFFIEITKDQKLGVPTSIHGDCAQVACPAAVESPYSENSLENIRENLEGFRLALTGGEGLGFDDIIIARGETELMPTFNANINAALDLIDEIETSLRSQSEAQLASGDEASCANSSSNPDSVRTTPMCSLHAYVKRITDAMDIEFAAIVNIDLPDRSQSDND